MSKLIEPCVEYEARWRAALQALEEEGTGGFWNMPEPPTDIHEYIQRTQDFSQGANLPEGWVPNTTFWLVEGEGFLGHVNIRHELNDWLLKRGGHIGYAIAPAARRQGYGTKMLELALEKARDMGLQKVLVTCGDENIGSRKIIERAGGTLEDLIDVEGEQVRRYWIQT